MITLEEFLVRAKKHGYASGEPPITLKEEPRVKAYQHSEESLEPGLEYRLDYEDKYRGYYSFFGIETVKLNDKEIWKMSYSGHMLPEHQEPDFTKQTFDFLKEALKRVRITKPFRGPDHFQQGEFRYFNRLEGDINFFKGTEIIFFKDKEVYRLYYVGGTILHKS